MSEHCQGCDGMNHGQITVSGGACPGITCPSCVTLTTERDARDREISQVWTPSLERVMAERDALKEATLRVVEAVKDWHPSGESSALEMEAAVEAAEVAMRGQR
jgi:hypothetical protein